MSPTIHLQTANGEIFEVDLELVTCSETITNMLEKEKAVNETVHKAIYLEKINSVVLRNVLEWMRNNKVTGNPKPTVTETSADIVLDDWNLTYLNQLCPGDLFELIAVIRAADYLDIKGLLDMTAQKFIQMIKGRTVEEIRKAFHIKNDFSQEEYEQIIKENEWCKAK